MASEILSIEIRSDGSRVVRRSIEDIGKASDRTHNSVVNLKNALLAISGGLLLRELTNLVNTYAKIQNRLRVVTTGTEELAQATEDLFKVSQRTRNSFENTVELYTRLSLATRQMGLDQEQALTFTERLNKAIIVSGATAQEAHNALIQFSQGLSKGVLNGDELRSVLEQLPMVADVIAKQMGVTRGALRGLGEQGLITAEVILQAFENSADEIEAAFTKTIVTLPQAWTVLKNSLVKNIGEIDKALGLSQNIGKVMIDFANNLPDIVKKIQQYKVAIFATTIALIAFNLQMGLANSLLRATLVPLARFMILLNANPISLMVAALAGAVTVLYMLRDQLKVSETGIATFGDLAVVTFNKIKEILQIGADYFTQFANFLDDKFGAFVRNVFSSLSNLTFAKFIRAAAFMIDTVISAFIGFGRAIGVALAGVPDVIANVFKNGLRMSLQAVENGINSILRKASELSGGLFEEFRIDFGVEPTVVTGAEQLGKDISEAFKSGLGQTSAQDALTDLLIQAEDRAQDRLRRTRLNVPVAPTPDTGGANDVPLLTARQIAINDINRELDTQAKFLHLINAEREIENKLFQIQEGLRTKGVILSEDENEAFRDRLRLMQSLQAEGDLREAALGQQYALNMQLEAYNRILQKTPELAAAMRAAILEQNSDILTTSQNLNDIAVSQYENSIKRIQALRDANVLSEADAAQAMMQAQVKLNETKLSSTRNYFETLAGLSRSENKKMAAIGKAAAVVQATIDGYVAVQKALASAPPPWNFALAGAVGAMTAQNIAAILAQDLPAFKLGGSMMIKGPGGTDSQIASFKATPGERIDVLTPAQQRTRDREGGAGGRTGHNINVTLPGITNAEEARQATPVVRRGIVRAVAEAQRYS